MVRSSLSPSFSPLLCSLATQYLYYSCSVDSLTWSNPLIAIPTSSLFSCLVSASSTLWVSISTSPIVSSPARSHLPVESPRMSARRPRSRRTSLSHHHPLTRQVSPTHHWSHQTCRYPYCMWSSIPLTVYRDIPAYLSNYLLQINMQPWIHMPIWVTWQ